MTLTPLPSAVARGIASRVAGPDDFAFIEALYVSSRAEELAQTGWPAAQQHAFLVQQHRAQHHHYQRHYADAERQILERDGVAIGRLYLGHWEAEIRIVDITLLPELRGQGIGGAILRDLGAAAAAAGKAVSIHVEKMNPARRLYLRTGFVLAEDKGVYDLMTWHPAPGSGAPADARGGDEA